MALKSVFKSMLCFIFHFIGKQKSSRVDVFAWLPEELIIYHILLKLPVKTLLRLKSVSKSWLSLISSPEFIEIHLGKSTNDPQFTHTHLLASFVPFAPNGEPEYVPRFIDSFTSLSLYSLLNNRLTEPIEHDYLGDKLYIVGHCKGLVCVGGIGRVLLWNPSTRVFRRLPKLEYMSYRYGFGYDELNNDFKVVAICDSTHLCSEREVLIYSSKTDSWRMIGNFPFKGVVDDDGIFTNGAIHWIIRPSMRFKSIVIASLDLKTETYREILPPEYGIDVDRISLGIFDKNLSFCECNSANVHTKLWIMKKCDVQECWTQLVTVPTDLYRFITWFLKPTQISVNGDFILSSDSNLRLYNSKDNTYKELLDRETGWLREVNTYVESLVSPLL